MWRLKMLNRKAKTRKRKAAKKRVYARIVTPLRLILWQGYAILFATLLNLGLLAWHHEMTMLELRGKVHTTFTLIEVCTDVGISDCNKLRKAWKQHAND